MTVRIYKWTDVGAPILGGVVGSFIGILDACLVGTGGFAYGSTPSLGWTKPYSSTNIGVYQQGAGSNGFCLQVYDDASAVVGSVATNAAMRGYESMSAFNSGTNPFPTIAQASANAGPAFRKCTSAAATNVEWVLVGDEQGFYFWCNANGEGSVYSTSQLWYFGDITTLKAGDAYHTGIFSSIISGVAASVMYENPTRFSTPTASMAKYLARTYLQTGTSVTVSTIGAVGRANNALLGGGGSAYPNNVDNNLYMEEVTIYENIGVNLRGKLPGFWFPLHNRPLQCFDTFSGSGTLAGKTFMAFNGGTTGQVLIEISDTWR